MKKLIAALSVAFAAAALAMVGGATPAFAASAAITVTPSTGLHNNDAVTVAGTNFPAGSVYLVECSTVSMNGCDTSNLVVATAAANGSFSMSFTVHTGTIGDGTCAAGSSSCSITASNNTAAGTANAGIAFAAPAPAVTVTPSTGLHNNDAVTVAGTNFPAGSVYLVECSTVSANGCDTSNLVVATAAANGTFSMSFTVHTGTIGNGTCAAGSSSCSITASNNMAGGTANAGIAFASTAPAITVTPSTGLHDGDAVTVAGTNFPAGSVYLVECSTVSANGCDTSNLVVATAAANGTFSMSFTVHTGTIGDGTCAAGSSSCSITASNNTAAGTANAGIAFAGASQPAITVKPATGLTNGQVVTVSGVDFPKGKVYLDECSKVSSKGCDQNHVYTATAGADGQFSHSVRIRTGATGNGKCLGGGTCYIAASNRSTPSASASAVIRLASTAPTIQVTPSTGLKNKQTVTVSGVRYKHGRQVRIVECSTITTKGCDTKHAVTVTVGPKHGFSTKFTVFTGAIGNGKCSSANSCYISAHSVTGHQGDHAVISFAKVKTTVPMITVTPNTGLKNKDTVTVKGTNFPAGNTFVVECSAVTSTGCDENNLGSATVSAGGTFSTTFTVHTGAIGDGTCNSGQTCKIVATNGSSPAGTADIKFA